MLRHPLTTPAPACPGIVSQCITSETQCITCIVLYHDVSRRIMIISVLSHLCSTRPVSRRITKHRAIYTLASQVSELYHDVSWLVSESIWRSSAAAETAPWDPCCLWVSRIAGLVTHGIIAYLRIWCGCVSERIVAFSSAVRKWSESGPNLKVSDWYHSARIMS